MSKQLTTKIRRFQSSQKVICHTQWLVTQVSTSSHFLVFKQKKRLLTNPPLIDDSLVRSIKQQQIGENQDICLFPH
jgi:hypothetical protein